MESQEIGPADGNRDKDAIILFNEDRGKDDKTSDTTR